MPEYDAGEPGADAGDVEMYDAGISVPSENDAGEPGTDAGDVERDAGPIAVGPPALPIDDAGEPGIDAG
ncbi:MAG: hypothetical protein GY822_19735 [Deltaproteobacteria bacterium]|nr:hypothetical protein [Deltaproteobacteria bacterium]